MRTYVIADTSEVSGFEFDQLIDINELHSRKSLDGSKILARYKGTQPFFLLGKTEYTHEEILSILSGPEWTSEEPI
tara:strand:- start:540 stop:767 length:228 start_codon:yes stop_codon:yes gene_type:complete